MDDTAKDKLNKLVESLDKLESTLDTFSESINTLTVALAGTSNKSDELMWESIKLPGVDQVVVNPVTKESYKLWNVIINLNDVQHWTREQIADWVESLGINTRFTIKENHEQS